MRNLRNIAQAFVDVSSDLPLAATAWDTTSDSIICAFGPCATKEVIELRRVSTSCREESSSVLIASWDALSPNPELECDKVLSLHHFAHNDTSCLVLEGGDIVVVRGRPLEREEKIEIVGSVDIGILAAAWSPDEELLATVSRAGTVLLMTSDFESAATIEMSAEDAKLSKHVSVGWGKSETQFRGKRNKTLRDPTMPETVDEGKLSPDDQGEATISWRGDGAFVAISTVEDQSRRMIRSYTREGLLDSVSEPVDGLEASLSWRPTGNLLAGIQRKLDAVQVVFFERNGLRHGQFALRCDRDDMATWAKRIRLLWSPDSSVLAVCFNDRVQLWTMSNYHYYLKQEINLSDLEQELGAMPLTWSSTDPLRFCLMGKDAHKLPECVDSDNLAVKRSYTNALHVHSFLPALAACRNSSPHDYGLVAVVDGCTVKLTPLRRANVPPPMCLHEIEVDNAIIDVAINSTSSRVAVLHQAHADRKRFGQYLISVFQYAVDATMPKEPLLDRVVTLPVYVGVIVARQLSFWGIDIFVLLNNLTSRQSLIYSTSSQRFHNLSGNSELSDISRLFTSVGDQRLHILNDRDIYEVVAPSADAIKSETLIMEQTTHLEAFGPWVEVTETSAGTTSFVLTQSGHLYAGSRTLLRNCTSFLVTSSYLVLTTTSHLLKFVHLTNDPSTLEVPPDEPETDERCRSIERGARLVVIMPTTNCVILQMPRGNLESIYPRALVVAGIRESIDAKDYKKAFLACRKQRVDLNILHDHLPQQFLANVDLIVSQLEKVEHIDLLLSQLRDEDVTQSMYRERLTRHQILEDSEQSKGTADPATEGRGISMSKTNRICNAFLIALQSRGNENVQNMITANVCKSPPDLEAGLRIVTKLVNSTSGQNKSAIEHVCFLVDVNRVFDAALGLYDLELALKIAQQSQKDPREYLPYLQKLQGMPEPRRQFAIDDQLGRKARALKCLHSLQAHDEILTYTQRHELYSEALELYRYDVVNQRVVLNAFAKYLSERNRFPEAAIVYESLLKFDEASESYRSAEMWQECISSALLAQHDPSKMSVLAQSLADNLVESKDYKSAALIYRDHILNVDSAVRYFCKSYCFSDAIRLLAHASRQELLLTTLDQALIEASASLTELLADCKSQLGAQLPRLNELRAKKVADPLAFYEGADSADMPDNISLAATDTSTTGGNTIFTRYTNRTDGTLATATSRKTSKNRRREERKRARGKKGSVYEEEYLVNSIRRLIDRVNEANEDASRTVNTLQRRAMRERARAVEESMVDVVARCQACIAEVFGNEANNEVIKPDEQESRPEGADGVLWDSMNESSRNLDRPVMKKYARSALLIRCL